MTPELEKEARELLAAEYEATGFPYPQLTDWSLETERFGGPALIAIRAICAALSRPTEALEGDVEAVARALHEEFSRQNIVAYLDREFDLHAAARAAIAAMPATGQTGLRDALGDAREAIASLEEDVFGFVEDGRCWWPIRNELLAKIDAALSLPVTDHGEG